MSIHSFFSLLEGWHNILYGMQMMSTNLEAAAGSRMKQILERLTANRFLGVFVGCEPESSYPVLIRHNRHGGGLRQLPAHDTQNSCLDHHGRQYRIITVTGQLIALDIGPSRR